MLNYVFNVKKNIPDNFKKILVALPFMLISIVLDSISKIIVINNLPVYKSISVLGDFFKITHVKNPYMAFSIKIGNYWIMIALSIFSILIIIFFFLKSSYKKGESIAYGLILGGAFGNMYERLRYKEVTDMFDFGIKQWRYATFNVADMSVVIGVCLIILFIFLDGKNE